MEKVRRKVWSLAEGRVWRLIKDQVEEHVWDRTGEQIVNSVWNLAVRRIRLMPSGSNR